MHDWRQARLDDHGLITRPELLANGLDDRAIRRAIVTKTLHRLRPGAFVPAASWDALTAEDRHRVRARAVLLNANRDAVLSHTSALLEHGTPLWGADLSRVHLTRFDDRAGRVRDDLVQHQGVITVDDVTRRHGLMVTSGTRTALDLARLLTIEQAVVVTSGLLRAGETTLGLLHDRYQMLPSRPDSRRTRIVLRLADGRFESAAESRAFFAIWAEGLPIPIPQYEIWDAGHLVARLDFAWPYLKTWLEVDGEAKYRSLRRPGESIEDVVLREKRREDVVRGITDWACVRAGWRDLDRRRELARRIEGSFTRPSMSA